jgi:hypothetical protein
LNTRVDQNCFIFKGVAILGAIKGAGKTPLLAQARELDKQLKKYHYR